MKSFKRGRGPSMMEGVMSVAVGIFGLLWTVMALQVGGGVFALFGVVFVIAAIAQAIYAFSNATRKKRFSEYDVTSDEEEADPLNARFGGHAENGDATGEHEGEARAFCPYCGAKAGEGFVYCAHCGKRL